MNRRYFLGLALSAVTAPAFANVIKREKSRILNLHHVNTGERTSIVYRIGDNYQRDGLAKLNRFLRDHRNDESIGMDPQLFDLLYDLQMKIHGEDCCIQVFSGYRSPLSNAKLRRASKRVARNSLHITGQAVDVTFEGCSNAKLYQSAISLSRGGVGYYGRGSFVHLDTGPVRSWRA